MAKVHASEIEPIDSGRRPPRAVVGSHRVEEEMFGRAFDKNIIRRIWAFVRPYRAMAVVSVAALLVFTGTQLLIPLIIRYAIDQATTPAGVDRSALLEAAGAFALAILVNFGAAYAQEIVVGKMGENVLFDIRRAMFAHLQKVSLSFMDKTEVGRLMSRLQGDVNSIHEFLKLQPRPSDALCLAGPVDYPHRLAAACTPGLHGCTRHQFSCQRRVGRSHSRRAHRPVHGPPAGKLPAV